MEMTCYKCVKILCAASINYHMSIFINFLSYVFCVKINKE